MDANRFRKKPVEIEAVRWTGENVIEVYSFMHGNPGWKHGIETPAWDDFVHLHSGKPWIISTLEAKEHTVAVGDWIIKGVQGEFYSCKPDIFEATYEQVDTRRGAVQP